MPADVLDLSSFELPDAGDRDPRENPYGYFARDGFVLSGVGVFRWFGSEAEAVRGYAAELIVHLYADADEDHAADRENLKVLFFGALREGKTLADLRDSLNVITGDISELVWCGTFQQLLTSNHEFAVEVRNSFLDGRDEDDSESAGPVEISESDVDEFVEFVQGYGY